MKFLKAEAFEKHLEESLPDHPSLIYGIAIADPFERKFIIKRFLKQLEGNEKWMRFHENPVKTFLKEIDSPTLFSSKRILIYDEIEGLKKGDFLEEVFTNLSEELHVIFGGTHIRFYESLKKNMVLLDLSNEKPWERINRLKRWLLQEIQQEGKRVTPDAAAYLSELCVENFEALMQEVQKLLLYVGNASEIDLKSVQAIITLKISQKGWELSEAIVWGGKIHFPTLHRLNSQESHLFLGQLRYQMQLGLVISSCLEKGEEHIIKQEYPKLPEKVIDKYKQLTRAFSISYFKEGLEDLFELELQARMKRADLSLLFDYFIAQMKKRALHV